MKKRAVWMTMMSIAASAGLASAAQYRFRKHVDPWALQQQLTAAGIKVQAIDCASDDCTITLAPGETRSPKAIVDSYAFDDPKKQRADEAAALRSLVAKWNAGTISPTEKDDLIRRFIVLNLPAE